MGMKELVEDLKARRQRALGMGGPEAIARQHADGELTVRERRPPPSPPREIALTKRMPMVWLIDSAGARIQEAIGSTFAQSGFLFREESIMSGVVPMVAAMLGPGAAGTAYLPAPSDLVLLVKGPSHTAARGGTP